MFEPEALPQPFYKRGEEDYILKGDHHFKMTHDISEIGNFLFKYVESCLFKQKLTEFCWSYY